jgi:TDG/mug DNA glycosylase family protein
VAAPWRPTREQVAAAEGRTIPDVLEAGLDVVFCGINPSLYSGAVSHHFARPGNRFWKALHQAAFTDRELSPFEDGLLPRFGVGLTNLVERATAGAADLRAAELRTGAVRLGPKVKRFRPRLVAVLGVGAYRTAFGLRTATVGSQAEPVGGAAAWVLPNPSGRNASYQLPDLVRCFEDLRRAMGSR